MNHMLYYYYLHQILILINHYMILFKYNFLLSLKLLMFMFKLLNLGYILCHMNM